MPLTVAEKSARYRAKDIAAYRAKKAAYARTPAQREVRREYMKKWREENRAAFNKICRVSQAKAKLSRTPQERHDQHLRSWYGITRADYLELLEHQGGCAICGAAESGTTKHFHVDHCHVSHKIRGLLCNSCNGKLGWFERYAVETLAYLQQDLTESPEVRTPSKLSAKRSRSNWRTQ